MKTVEISRVISNVCISPDIYDIVLECPKISSMSKAGQFVEIYPDNGVNILARPISICETGNAGIRIVFRKVGKGTEIFLKLKPEDNIRIMGPCGNGYTIKEGSSLLVGGGIGVPPLLELCKQLKGEKTVVLGYASNTFLVEDFEKTGAKVYISTDDGSAGFKGNTVELIKSLDLKAEHIYACGPGVMLKALSEFAAEKNIDTQISTEERMACGIGACVGCAILIAENGQNVYKKVCKDGPVFNSREVVWNE